MQGTMAMASGGVLQTTTAPVVTLPIAPGPLFAMHPLEMYALCAGTAMTVIAVALWLASTHTDRLALRLFSLRYAIAAAGWFFVHPHVLQSAAALPFASMALAVAIMLLIAVALDLYLGLFTRRRAWLEVAAAAAALLLLYLCHRLWPLEPWAIYGVLSAGMGWFGIVAWQAAAREHNAGHRIIAVAMASYPVVIAAGLLTWPGDVRRLDLSFIVALPSGIVGMAILLASLVRFGRRLERELAQREAAEREVRVLNDELEQRVRARTAELHSIVEGLESFTRNVSHDLRGPLAGVAGVARLAQDALARGDTRRAQRMLAPLAPQADRLALLVQDLLLLSRVTESPCRRVRQPLRPVLDAALEQLRLVPESAAALATVALEIGDLPEVAVDAGLMQQVLVNLLGNALRFALSAPGGVPRVTVTAEAGNDGATTLVVSDTGPGLPPGHEAQLFKPFARLHGQGLSRNGIGLSIVHRIVEHHGARVWAEAAPGGGARFCLAFAHDT